MSCDYVLRIYYTLLPRTGACKLMRISPSDKYVYGLRSMDYGVWSPPYFVPASLFARTVVTGSSSFRLMKAYGVHGLHADNRVWSTYSVQNNATGSTCFSTCIARRSIYMYTQPATPLLWCGKMHQTTSLSLRIFLPTINTPHGVVRTLSQEPGKTIYYTFSLDRLVHRRGHFLIASLA